MKRSGAVQRYQRNAQRLKQEIDASPGPERALYLLERLAAESKQLRPPDPRRTKRRPSRTRCPAGSVLPVHTPFMSLTGPIPDDVRRDLEALKVRLVSMAASDLPAADAELVAREISAIRLQLKRLAAEREAMAEALRRLDRGANPGELQG
jgi:hypothetical protein